MEKLIPAKEHVERRVRLKEIVGRLLAMEGASQSPAVVGVLHDLGIVSYRAGALETSKACWSTRVTFCNRNLPPDYNGLHREQLTLASVLAALGDLHGARALGEATS